MLAAAARSPRLVGAGPASRHISDRKCFRSTGVPQCTTDKLSTHTHTHTQTPVITRQNQNKPAKNLIEISCYSSGSDSPHRHRRTHTRRPNAKRNIFQWAMGRFSGPLCPPPHCHLLCERTGPIKKCMLPWASMSLSPNVISIGSSVSAQLTSVPNTHRHVDHATCDV